jgi:hypothetical protein
MSGWAFDAKWSEMKIIQIQKYDKFLQWSKNKSKMRGPQIYGRKFHPKGRALKLFS